MADLAKLQSANSARWAVMKVKSGLSGSIDAVARRLIAPAAKVRFIALSERTGVPWPIIAVIKEREAGADSNWLRSIAQGDPWNAVSKHVPKGRGPFKSWESAAFDALSNCAPYAARWKDWSPGGAMTLLEQYNGLGYARKGLPSPYIWAGTDQYVKGKYVADGVFDANHVDTQIGCAALLARMIALDPSADFTKRTPVAPTGTVPVATAVAVATAAGTATAAAHAVGLSGSTILVIALGTLFVMGIALVIWSNRK